MKNKKTDNQEFIIEKQELFWDKKNNSLDFWKKQTENYYKAYSEFEIKGVSSIILFILSISIFGNILKSALLQSSFS